MRTKLFSIVIVLLLFSVKGFSQTYPFKENFQPYISNQPPTGGWSGDMKVLLDHGLSDSKALVGDMGGTNLVDSAISPLIGPLNSSSVLTFFYRAIDWANYPSTPTNFDNGDQVEAQISTDGVNFQQVFLIDLNNHVPSFNFKKSQAILGQYAGDTVRIKFRCQFGSGARYFVDIDSVSLAGPGTVGINDVDDPGQIQLFPNPANANSICMVRASNNEPSDLKLFDITGRNIFSTKFVAGCQLPVAGLSCGVYFVEVEQQQQTFTRKLIIQQ